MQAGAVMRVLRGVPVLIALAALALPAAAGARRDDKPIELYRPSDGAVVKDATKGLKVDFTCPAYHPDAYETSVGKPGDGYSVTLSRTPDVDEFGALAPGGVVDVRTAVPLPPSKDGVDHCEPELNIRGESLLPLEPGKYWWQASRVCAGYVCRGGIEVSPVNVVEVRVTVCSKLRAQSKATRSALRKARREAHRAPRSRARRAKVTRLSHRLDLVRERLRVVYDCAR
jgi:hypothetical protein